MDLRDYDRMPAVGAAMTPFPHFVRADTPVTEVERLMDAHDIRHIPVLVDAKVVGIISERDLHRLVNPALPAVNKQHIKARNVMVADPYVVETKTPLAEVLSEMADRRIGSAVVVKSGKLAGIFSVTDACRILARELHTRFPDDHEAA